MWYITVIECQNLISNTEMFSGGANKKIKMGGSGGRYGRGKRCLWGYVGET